MTKKTKTISWIARIIAAFILLQTLYFKFSAAPESVYIFSTVGIEPWGRIGTGVVELIASILLLVPAFCWMGSIIAIGIMSAAIFFHVTILGIEVMHDGGLLFFYALTVLIMSVIILIIHRESMASFIKRVAGYKPGKFNQSQKHDFTGNIRRNY